MKNFHLSSRDIQHALKFHGYDLTKPQIKHLRLHTSVRLLHRKSPNDNLNEIHTNVTEVMRKLLESGQAIRWGRSYWSPAIRKEGLFLSERDLREHLREINPDASSLRFKSTLRKRGRFMVKGPNRVWSIDGHDKLARFGFEIYASIDAYSRFITWCYCGHSNRTSVSVNRQYLQVVRITGKLPKLLRSDMGSETILICNSHILLRRALKPDLPFERAYSFGTSTKNQRIEHWWNLLANAQTDTWRALFCGYEDASLFDGGDIDKACLQFIYMDMIRLHIHAFVEQHNNHRIRKQRNRSHYLPTGRPTVMYHYPPDNIRDYAEKPDETMLAELESQVQAYDLNEYLPSETMILFSSFLEENNMPTKFTFQDNHMEAYLYLRERAWKYDGEILALSKPTGVERWIERYGEQINWHHENDQEMEIGQTDNEDVEIFDEEAVEDEDETENGSEEEDMDDGHVLNILDV